MESTSQNSLNGSHSIHSTSSCYASTSPLPTHSYPVELPGPISRLLLDPKLLFTRLLTSALHKATGILCQLFPLLARDSTLSIPNKITLYKLRIRTLLTYSAPVWSNTSTSNYRRLQILQSKCLRVIGNFPRHTPIPRFHSALNVAPIHYFIYHLTDNSLAAALSTPTPSTVP